MIKLLWLDFHVYDLKDYSVHECHYYIPPIVNTPTPAHLLISLDFPWLQIEGVSSQRRFTSFPCLLPPPRHWFYFSRE